MTPALPVLRGRRLVCAGLLLLLLGGASACHSVEGLGQDLSALGDMLSSKGHDR